MSLTLVTGPANAAKAGAVLDRLRAALPRDPLLVVPTSADVDHYQRELAAAGVVFGAEVLTFSRLIAEIARRTGLTVRPLGRVARDQVVRAALRDVPLRVLATSAATPGFAAAAGALFAELQRSLVAPARFTAALRAWGAAEGRAAYADELAALYAAYRRRLERLGRPDREGHAWAALDALRAAPAAWGRRPVFLYGFDDLTPTQRDAVETMVRHAEADVCVALPYEPGRVAFAGCAGTVAELQPLAAELVHLPERAEHYAAAARPALHHLERRLFEPGAAALPPNGAVRLLEAGGERAEAELVGAAVLELMRQGIDAPDIAVLLRGNAAGAALFAQVLAGYGIPVAHDRRVALDRTRLGAGVLAGARAALPDGTAADLLTWLRTPGRLPDLAAADALEARVRRGEVRSARGARALWDGPPLDALDALAAAAEVGSGSAAGRARRRGGGDLDRPAPPPGGRPGRGGPGGRARGRRAARRDGRAARAGRRRPGPARHAGRRAGRPGRRRGARAVRGGAHRRGRAVRALGPGAGRAARRPARDPGAALPRGVRVRAPGRGVPAPARARAVSLRCRPARHHGRRRPAAAAARGRARPRALAVLQRRVAPPRRAVPVLALVRRGGRSACAVAVPRRRPRAVRRRALEHARHAPAGRRHLGAARRAHAARAAPRLRRGEPVRRAGAARATADRGRAGGARRAPDRGRARAGGLRRLRRALADRAAPAAGPDRSGPRAAAARIARPSRARAHPAPAARADRLGARHPRAARRRARGAARRARRARRRGPGRRAAPRRAARAGGRPRALPAHRGRVRRRLRAGRAGVVVRRGGR